jgi:hypothetical protein
MAGERIKIFHNLEGNLRAIENDVNEFLKSENVEYIHLVYKDLTLILIYYHKDEGR